MASGTLQLNQDCVDIVAEYSVTDLETLLGLRLVSHTFWTSVQNLLLLLHRRSGEPAGVLNEASMRPLNAMLHPAEPLPPWQLVRVALSVNAEHFTHMGPSGLLFTKDPGASNSRFSVVMDIVATRCKQLEVLDCPGVSITDEGLEAVAHNCPRIRDLRIGSVSEVTLGVVSVACRALTSLTVGEISNAALCSLARSCGARLEQFDVSFDACQPLELDLGYFAERCPRLRCFTLQHRRLSSPQKSAVAKTVEQLVKLATLCPTLRSLRFRCQPGLGASEPCTNAVITDAALEAIAHARPELEELALCCSKVTDSGLKAVSKACRGLRYLDVARAKVTDDGVFAVGEHCSSLTELDVSHTKVTQTGVLSFAVFPTSLTSLRMAACELCLDPLFKALAKKCPELRTVIAPQADVTDEAVIALAQGCPELETLGLVGSKRLTGACLAAIASNCPNMKAVCVWHGLASGASRSYAFVAPPVEKAPTPAVAAPTTNAWASTAAAHAAAAPRTAFQAAPAHGTQATGGWGQPPGPQQKGPWGRG